MQRIISILVFLFSILSENASAQQWKQFSDSAKIFQDSRKNSEAIEYYIKAKDLLAIDSPKCVTLGRLTREIGGLYQALGKYPQAEKYYLESKQVFMNGNYGDAEYFRSCNYLNYLYILMSKYDLALKLCLETYEEAKKNIGPRHYDFSRSSRNLGMLYRALGKFTDAEDYLLAAQSIVLEVKGKNTFEYASITNDVGALYLLMARSEEALEQLLIAKNGYAVSVGKESGSYGSVNNNLGLVYKNMGEYSLSEQHYMEALRVRGIVDGPNTPSYAQANYNLADLYLLIGQFQKAEQLLYEAERVYKVTVTAEHPEYARVCSKLGVLYTHLNDYEKAESYLLLSKAIREKKLTRNNPEYAISVWYLAEMNYYMGRTDSAEKYLNEAYTVWRKILGESHPEVFNASVGLARLYIQQRAFGKAKELLDEIVPAWSHFGKANSSHRQIQGLYARLYWMQKDSENAYLYYRNALASQLTQVREVFRFTSEPEKIAFLSNVISTNDEFYSFFNSMPGKGAESYNLSLAYRELVLSSFRSLRESIQRSGDSSLIKEYNKWMDLRETLADYYSTNQVSDDLKVMEDSANKIEKELIRKSPAARQYLNSISWQSISEKLKPGEAAIEFIRYNDYDGENWKDSVFYAAILLIKGKSPEVIRLFEEKELQKLVDLHKSSGGGKVQLSRLYSWREPGAAGAGNLYDLVWRPFSNKLEKIKTIYFTPGGALFRISIAAITVSKTEVLSDRYRLVQMNTTALVAQDNQASSINSTGMVLFGGIKYDSDSASMMYAASRTPEKDGGSRSLPEDLPRESYPDFNFLAGSARETQAIKNLAGSQFKGQLLDDKFATEEAFKALSGNNSPGILHIATHGFFFPDVIQSKKTSLRAGATVFRQSDNPLIRSGLALAGANNAWRGKPVPGVEDGILTAYEVSNMYLPNTKLAVLSACETGLGDIRGSEGVYGLQRAFKMAGVENLVMSLWKVPDQETAAFMQLFYENLFQKQSIQDAFYKAQTAMKTKYRNDPYKWAAWVLIR